MTVAQINSSINIHLDSHKLSDVKFELADLYGNRSVIVFKLGNDYLHAFLNMEQVRYLSEIVNDFVEKQEAIEALENEELPDYEYAYEGNEDVAMEASLFGWEA